MNTITFDDNVVVMKLKDFKNANDSRNHFYKCWRAKVEECENLQSKIDKAIEYCEYNNESLYTFEPDYDYEENIVDNYEPSNFREESLDILKEDK